MARPKSMTARKRVVHLRLSEEEYSMLLDIQSETGELFSDFLRKALKFYYNFRKNIRR